MLTKIVCFKLSLFWTNLSKFQTFYEIVNFNFGLYLAFFEIAYGQIWPFKFFWTWQPWFTDRWSNRRRGKRGKEEYQMRKEEK